MSAILIVQNDCFPGVCANANIGFWILHAPKIPKMYSFTNPLKFPTKIHILMNSRRKLKFEEAKILS